MIFDFKGQSRRTELNLRAHFPELKTRLFSTKGNLYKIFCINIGERFDEINTYFENKIKPIGIPIILTDKMPSDALEELSCIEDNEISKNYEGVLMRTIDLLNLLTARFKNIRFRNVQGNDGDNKIKIHVDGIISEETRKSLKQFLTNMRQIIDFEIIENSTIDCHNLFENPSLYIYSSKIVNQNLEFVERDEALWFDNLDNFYDGSYKKNMLYFIEDTKSCCYVDFSIFEHINLRNHIFLYDIVYITLPFEVPIRTFLNQQKAKLDELLDLIESGRVRILLTQPENRYDLGFIQEAYKLNPTSIISRRAINSAVLLDIIELNNSYFIHKLDLTPYIFELSQIFSEINQQEQSSVYNLLSWPIKFLRQSMSVLDFGSPMKLGSIGVNNSIQNEISKLENNDLTLEFSFTATNVHIASALGGVYFPYGKIGRFSDRSFAIILSNVLSFYKNSSIEKILQYYNFKKALSDNQKLIPDISVFEVNEYMPLKDFSIFSNFFDTPSNSTSLMTYLNSLTYEQRVTTIRRYNEQIVKNLKRSGQSKKVLDFTYSAALDTAGIWLPFLGTGIKIFDNVANKLNINKLVKDRFFTQLNKILEPQDTEKKHIRFLSKVNPIARLKTVN